jgi:pimeloyl-ACP methyl ester carboxylesterase
MHEAIAGKTFDNLLRVPGLSVPTRVVQAVHDAITQSVYAAVRHGGAAAFSLAAGAERLSTDPSRIPGGKEQKLRSALNGAMGDSLSAAGNPLAVQMAFYAHWSPLALTPAVLAPLRSRVCVFIHGLACDEGSWAMRTEAWNDSPWAHALPAGGTIRYGDLLEHELRVSAAYLRYNSGLALETNSRQFAALLDDLLRAAPQVGELVLIGHSMGGLVARRALAIAHDEELAWASRAAMLICLGSPNQGAALAKLGEFTNAALMASDVTRPIGRMASARSQGVKDLRHGLDKPARRTPPPAQALAVPLRLVYATLGDESGAMIGKVFGDGLVHAGSAADDGLTGDVERVEIAGLGHMGLLNQPRVYAVVRRWLGAPEAA